MAPASGTVTVAEVASQLQALPEDEEGVAEAMAFLLSLAKAAGTERLLAWAAPVHDPRAVRVQARELVPVHRAAARPPPTPPTSPVAAGWASAAAMLKRMSSAIADLVAFFHAVRAALRCARSFCWGASPPLNRAAPPFAASHARVPCGGDGAHTE